MICAALAFYATAQKSLDSYRNKVNGEFEKFREKRQKEFNEYRAKINKEYAEFMRKSWKRIDGNKGMEQPIEREKPPVTIPDNTPKPIEDRPLPFDDIVTPPLPQPQPTPIKPIEDLPSIDDKYVDVSDFGVSAHIVFNDNERFRLKSISPCDIADMWVELSDRKYNKTISSCLKMRDDYQLCDWAYLKMLDKICQACLGNGNESTLLMAFIYCQSGYKMRLACSDSRLYMLFASRHSIYNFCTFRIDGERFYPYDCKDYSLCIFDHIFPNEKPLSLIIDKPMRLAGNDSELRKLTSSKYPTFTTTTKVNKNVIDFYNDYPRSMLDQNIVSIWAIYANAPFSQEVQAAYYPQLRQLISGLDNEEAVQRILNYVQTSFVYGYDDDVWGHDRAFFPEETLYYPYCDCEDRAIFMSRLVRDLLGLKVILIYYPRHLALAVCFPNNSVKGDCIMLNGEKYLVADPTYIGASLGMTMPNMDNSSAKVILLSS